MRQRILRDMANKDTATIWGKRLIYVYYVEALVCKSQFGGLTGLWLLHMGLSVALIVALAFLGGTRAIEYNWKYHRTPTGLLAVFLSWAMISSLVSTAVYANVLWSVVFGLSIYVGTYATAFFFRDNIVKGLHTFLVILIAWALLGMAISVAAPGLNPAYDGYIRFRGASGNVGDAAENLSFGILLGVWFVQSFQAKKYYRLCAILMIIALILTRTRSVLLGMTVALPFLLCHNPVRGLSRRNLGLLVGGGMAIALVLLVGSLDETRWNEARTYLRLEEKDDTRSAYFLRGWEKIKERPAFGHGPMSKFGGQNVVTQSAYSSLNDPHNVFLLLAQYYGWPGAVLFSVYLLSCAAPFLRPSPNLVRPLMLSVLLWGAVISLASGWLLSFGMPADRLSYIMLGFGLASLPPNRYGLVLRNAGRYRRVKASSRAVPCPMWRTQDDAQGAKSGMSYGLSYPGRLA